MADVTPWSEMTAAQHLDAAQYLIENMYNDSMDIKVAELHVLAACAQRNYIPQGNTYVTWSGNQ